MLQLQILKRMMGEDMHGSGSYAYLVALENWGQVKKQKDRKPHIVANPNIPAIKLALTETHSNSKFPSRYSLKERALGACSPTEILSMALVERITVNIHASSVAIPNTQCVLLTSCRVKESFLESGRAKAPPYAAPDISMAGIR